MSFLDHVKERGAFKIENTEDAPLKIILKPWGQELELAPNLAVEVFFVGESFLSDNLVVTVRPDALVLTVRDPEGAAFFRMRGRDEPAPPEQKRNGANGYRPTAAE